MLSFRASVLIVLALALSACAAGPRVRGHLTAQEIESLMDRGEISEIFAGHTAITITLDTGEVFTASLPSAEKVQAYIERREAIGKPVDYQME